MFLTCMLIVPTSQIFHAVEPAVPQSAEGCSADTLSRKLNPQRVGSFIQRPTCDLLQGDLMAMT